MFNHGDKVRCIKGYDDFLTTDKVYIVKNSDTHFTEVEHDDWGHSSSHYTHRFELVKEEPKVNKVFKRGDKVRCIQSYANQITKGRTYVVDDFEDNEWVRLKNNQGVVGGYYHTRFEHVKEEEAKVSFVKEVTKKEIQYSSHYFGALNAEVRLYSTDYKGKIYINVPNQQMFDVKGLRDLAKALDEVADALEGK